jgi:hypothetical protein
VAHNNKLEGFKAQVQSPPKWPTTTSFKASSSLKPKQWPTTTRFKDFTKFKPTKRPHKLNLQNNLPFSHKISPFHTPQKAQQAPIPKHLPIYQKAPQAQFLKQLPTPHFSNYQKAPQAQFLK